MDTTLPLRFEPLFRDYLWGGRKLHSELGKSLPAEGVWAESWEIVDHAEHQSRISQGPWCGQTIADIAAKQPEWLFGKHVGQFRHLPLLLKYLDCQRVLSVQVHPNDAYGMKMQPPDLGKTEAWYILAAEPGAVVYAGLKAGVDAAQLRSAVAAGKVEECLHELRPQAGDCIFIPAGTVHALGAGLLVAEIQQASNTTFRLFDWNRIDAQGKPRALHVEQAIEVIDFACGPSEFVVPEVTDQPGRFRLVACDKFYFDRLGGIPVCRVGGDSRFHFLTVAVGSVELRIQDGSVERLSVGQSILLPAASAGVDAVFSGGSILLDMYVP